MYQRKRGRAWRTIRPMGDDAASFSASVQDPSVYTGDLPGAPSGGGGLLSAGTAGAAAGAGGSGGGGGTTGQSAADKIIGAIFGGSSSSPPAFPGYPPGVYPPGYMPGPGLSTGTLLALLAGGGLVLYTVMKD